MNNSYSGSLVGVKVAILVANGFEEACFTVMQKFLTESGAMIRIISPENGLVNGWEGSSWGHNYAIDARINEALGADYDALVIVGGERSMNKLALTAHTRRFIGSFMASEKPVIAMGDAVNIMNRTDQLNERTISGDREVLDALGTSTVACSEEGAFIDKNLLTGEFDPEDCAEFLSKAAELFECCLSSSVRDVA